MTSRLAGALLPLALACGSGAAHQRPPGHGHTPDTAQAGSGAGSGGAAAPTERECEALIAHAISLRVAELRQTLPPEQVPTEAEQAALGTELRGKLLGDCRGGTRRGYDCAIAAKSLAELGGCQATRSSSTSNSSVAPGGIAPPAPRSP
jgi:hypothetical protein